MASKNRILYFWKKCIKEQKGKCVSVFPSHLLFVSVCLRNFLTTQLGQSPHTALQLALLANFTPQALSCTRLFSYNYARYLSSPVLDMLGISNYFCILKSCEDFPMQYVISTLCPDHVRGVLVRDLILWDRVIARL